MKTKITHEEQEPRETERGGGTEAAQPRSAQPRGSSGKAGKVIGLVALGLLAAVGLVAVAGGGALLWVNGAKTDGQGFYRSSPHQFETESRALVTNDLELDDGVASFLLGSDHLGQIQLTSTSNDHTKPLFVGIALEQDVAEYLRGVALDEVSDVELDPFRATYAQVPGDTVPAPPGDLSIWAASSLGTGSQTLDWSAEEGDWSVVVMNADGSANVDADVAAAARAPFIFRIGLGLLVGGIVVLLAAVATAVFVMRSGRRAQTTTWPAPAA